MLRENGEVNEAIAAAAKRAGARRFVLLSASSTMKWGYGGALEGGTSCTQLATMASLCGGRGKLSELAWPGCRPCGSQRHDCGTLLAHQLSLQRLPPRRARGVHRRQGAWRGRRAARLRPRRHGRGRREPRLRRRPLPAPRPAARGCNPLPPACNPKPQTCSRVPPACSPVPAGPILEANGRSAPARGSVRFFKWLKSNAATVTSRLSNLGPTYYCLSNLGPAYYCLSNLGPTDLQRIG